MVNKISKLRNTTLGPYSLKTIVAIVILGLTEFHKKVGFQLESAIY